MASLVAAAPGPPPATGPASAAPDPNAGRTWRLIPDPANPQGFLLLEGRFDATRGFVKNSDISIGTNLPDIQVSQQERLGDIVKDMVGATAELERLILNEVILPAYGLQGPGNPVDFYNFLMANKLSAQTELGPYITEGIFARSSVTRKGICYVVVVVPESGDKGAPFSTRYDPSNPGSVRYLNTGAIPMDPSSSNAGGNPLVWPLIGETVYYGDDCLFRFGLPHELMWQAKTLGNNQFEYTINPQPIGMLGQPTPPRPFTSDSIPSIITEGNRARMQRFSGLLQNGSFPLGIRPEALQSTIYKEEGDLMQILEYLCFYHAGYIYNPADPDPFDSLEVGSRKKSVMVTTDEVVFKICCDLGIPCIYTGGKSVDPETGVHISGYGAYKFYNPVIDRETAFKNTIMNIFNNKKGINDIQIQLLEDIKWKESGANRNIYYYKQAAPGSRPSRTDGMRVCFRLSDTAKIGQYNTRIDGLIAGITQKNAELERLKGIALAGIDGAINDPDVAEEDDKYSAIAGIIQQFDEQSQSEECLTQLYVDKAKAPTSVDTDVISVVHNCVDIGLCVVLTTLSSGRAAGGGKLTGGNGFTAEEWEKFKRDEFNITPDEGREDSLSDKYREYSITDMEHVTNSEYNVLLILYIILKGKIRDHLSKNITDDKYLNLSIVSICASIYSRYAYFVSSINILPVHSEPDYDFKLKIRDLCHFDSLYQAITETLALIDMGLDPTFKGQLAEVEIPVDRYGYIIGARSEHVNAILPSVIFLQPDESYNAPGLPRFTSGAARAPQMPSRASSNNKMPGIGQGPAMDLDLEDLDDERPVPPLFRSVTDLNAAAASSDATMQNYKSLTDKEERPTARLAWSHGDDAARAPVGKLSFRVKNPPIISLYDPNSTTMQLGNGGPDPKLLLPGAWSFPPNTGETGLPPPPIGRTVSEAEDRGVSSGQPQGPKYDRSFGAKTKSRMPLKKQTTIPDPVKKFEEKIKEIRKRQSRKADKTTAERRMGKIGPVEVEMGNGEADVEMGKRAADVEMGEAGDEAGDEEGYYPEMGRVGMDGGKKRTRKNKRTKTIKKSKPKKKNKTKRKNNINRK